MVRKKYQQDLKVVVDKEMEITELLLSVFKSKTEHQNISFCIKIFIASIGIIVNNFGDVVFT